MAIEVNFERLKPIGSGGTGTVYQYDGYNSPGKFVIKKFNNDIISKDLRAFIVDLVKQRTNASKEIRDFVDSMFVWPYDIVLEDGKFCGYIMPRLPEIYRHSFVTPLGDPSEVDLDLDKLFMDEKRLKKLSLPVPNGEARITITYKLLAGMRYLHKSKIIFRDINQRNIYVRIDTKNPRLSQVLFIDMDSCCGCGISQLKNPIQEIATPGWLVPEKTATDFASDVYKICLAIARLYSTSGTKIVDLDTTANNHSKMINEHFKSAFALMETEVSPEFAAMIRKGLNYYPSYRPTSDEIWMTLNNNLHSSRTNTVKSVVSSPSSKRTTPHYSYARTNCAEQTTAAFLKDQDLNDTLKQVKFESRTIFPLSVLANHGTVTRFYSFCRHNGYEYAYGEKVKYNSIRKAYESDNRVYFYELRKGVSSEYDFKADPREGAEILYKLLLGMNYSEEKAGNESDNGFLMKQVTDAKDRLLNSIVMCLDALNKK